MKILQVITSMRTGGAEKIVMELTEGLRRKGYEVDVALFQGLETQFKKALERTGCRIYSFSEEGNVYNPLNAIKLRRIIPAYDIVHAHNTAPQLFLAMAGSQGVVRKVTTEHNTTNRRRDVGGLRGIDRWMYGRYDHIVCISDKAEDNLRAYLGRIKTPISTIYNGIDVEGMYNALPDNGLMNHEGRFVSVMVAGFRPQKDQDTLIRAMALLPEKFELWLVGGGERKGQMEELVRELGISSRVRFLGVRSDVPNILKAADVVIMSTHYEGLSLSNIEGMSVGKPFIASDVDGVHDVTAGAGILIPHQDPQALADEIGRLAGDRDYYRAVADRCHARALGFDLDKMVEGYEKIYLELMEKS